MKKYFPILAIIPFLSSCGFFNNTDGDKEPPSQEKQLSQPTNISYNDTNYILTWSLVEHANNYKVDVNGSVTTVDKNEYYYVPVAETTTFKVQACDYNGDYINSFWSSPITYTIEKKEDKITQAEVNLFVDSLDQFADLQNVVGMYLDDGNMYVQAVYKVAGKNVLKTKCVEYSTPVTSLEDAITKEHGYVIDENEYTVSNYKSMESLLKSDSFAGQMEELNKNGYEFTIVTSQTVENKNGTTKNDSMIFAVIRAEKDGDVKYFQTEIECYVTSPSTHQEINYTTKLENPSSREVYEDSFNELTGDFYDFFDEIYQKSLN